MRSICENESVYFQLMDSFSALKFWRGATQQNEELELYLCMLSLYYNFTIKNTNNKLDYASKLQKIRNKLK